MTKIVFIDLDETLISNRLLEKSPNSVEVSYVFRGQRDTDHVILKPGSLELLAEIRKNYEHVYMLTAAVDSYAHGMNRTLGLGFKHNEIISRNMGEFEHILTKLSPIVSVLFDNLPVYANSSKISFLRRFGKVSYIKSPDFFGDASMFTSQDISATLGEINALLT